MNEATRLRPHVRAPVKGYEPGARRGSPPPRARPRAGLHEGGRTAAAVRTQAEIEAAVSNGVNYFEKQHMGRGPNDIRVHLIGDLLAVRLQGVLTAAEQQLVKTLAAEKGGDLLKQVRTHLLETARPVMEAMVEETTGAKVMSLHHDINTRTGEEVLLFTLAEAPLVRETRK